MLRFPTFRSLTVRSLTFLVLVTLALSTARAEDSPRWPAFRGVAARGAPVVDTAKTPEKWDIDKATNVRWRTKIAGLGLSSPVIWGDRVFLTTAVGEKGAKLKVGLYGDIGSVKDTSKIEFRVVALDRETGKVVWDRAAHTGVPAIKRHPKSSHANSTPATDGKRVVAFFGSEGLFCFDMHGKELWKADLGRLDSGYYVFPGAQWGFGSSPVIHEDRVIVQCDVQKSSFVAAISLETGKEIWRTSRKEVPTWSTPTIDVRDGRAQLIVNGYLHIGGYDVATGKEIWNLRGGGDIPVPTPIVWQDLVFVTNAHGSFSPIYALRTSAKGKIRLGDKDWKHESLVWSKRRGGNYMQTPIVYRDLLYACRDNGVLSCFDPRTGDRIFQKRLGRGTTGFTTSPVAADGKLYFTSEDGDVYVLAAGREHKELAVNELGSSSMATPAVGAGEILFRTRTELLCVGE